MKVLVKINNYKDLKPAFIDDLEVNGPLRDVIECNSNGVITKISRLDVRNDYWDVNNVLRKGVVSLTPITEIPETLFIID